MATLVIFNGSQYSIPSYGDSGWAQGAGNLSLYLVALASGTLQTTGGNFTLTAPVNFGASFGILASSYSSTTANPATLGAIRLALTDTIDWGLANLALSVVASRLTFNGQTLLVAGDLPGAITQFVEVYTAGTALNNYTGSLTVVNLVGSYVANGKNLFAFINGLCADVTLDYLETSTTSITFNGPLNVGDRLKLAWTTF